MKNIYKLKLWVSGGEDNEEDRFTDFYLDVNTIQGLYMPSNKNEDDMGINIFIGGYSMTIKLEDHIEKYLTETFIKESVTKL